MALPSQGKSICPAALQYVAGYEVPFYEYKGIDHFYDIGGILAQPELFDQVTDVMAKKAKELNATHIAGFDARGFLFTDVARKAHLPFIMLRKGGKMPNTLESDAALIEYGVRAPLHMPKGVVKEGDRVILVDDLIATGGTLSQGINLVRQVGATVVATACMVCSIQSVSVEKPVFKQL